MELFNPEDLPEGAELIFCGSTTTTGSLGEQKLECFHCHGPCWISGKNAVRSCRFVCMECFFKGYAGGSIGTTLQDLQDTLEHLGLPNIPPEIAMQVFEFLVKDQLKQRAPDHLRTKLQELVKKRTDELKGEDSMTESRYDKIAKVVVTFQEMAEVHRQLAETHIYAKEMMLMAASQFSKLGKPDEAMMRSGKEYVEKYTRLRIELDKLLEIAEQLITDLRV